MDERECLKLQTQLKNLRQALNSELAELRISRRDPKRRPLQEWPPGENSRREIVFLAERLETLAGRAIELARCASTDPRALALARDEILDLCELFSPWRGITTWMFERLYGESEFENDRVLRRYNKAMQAIKNQLAEAEFDFDRLPLSKRPQPSSVELDDWIRRSPTKNSKDAWELIKAQRELAIPTWKYFWERWQTVISAPRGRPKKSHTREPD